MRGRVGLPLAIAGVGLALAAFVAAAGWAVLSSAAPSDRAVLERVLREQGLVVFWAWVLATVLCGLVVARVWERYIRLPERLASATSLIATANPSHRLPEEGPAPLRQLATSVNRLAAVYQNEQSDVAVRIAEANANLEQERNRLAALMSELSVAVLVCSGAGRILLYNAAARHLLDHPEAGSSALVGLGRSVFAILDRNLIAYALERLDAGQDGVQPMAAVHQGRLLRAHIAPVTAATETDGERSTSGFVVTLEDMTQRAETAQARDDLLGALTQGTRSAVGAIRAAVENVLDYPQMEPAQRERFLQIVQEEATGLGRHLDASLTATADVLDDTWLVTDLYAGDLLETLARGLERESLTVSMAEPPDGLWVHVDGFALQRVLAALGARLRTDQDVAEVGLRITSTGRLAELDLTWAGSPVDTATVQEWAALTQSSPTSGASRTSPQDVIARHGGEIWSGTEGASEADGAYIRMLLPLARHVPAARTVRPARVSEPEPAGDWRATYDFSLIDPSTLPGQWPDRPLAELSFTVFDTETTGLSPLQGDKIISIGAVRIVNGRLLRQETFDQLVDPQRSVPEASVAIHGIRAETLVGAPTIDVVLPAFAAFAEDTVLVGHNVAFDLQFLHLAKDLAGTLLTLPVLDTLLLSGAAHPEQVSHSLEAMSARLGVNVIGRHSALGDALVTGEVFLKLLDVLAGQGIRTLGEAHEAAQRTYQAKKSDSLYVKG